MANASASPRPRKTAAEKATEALNVASTRLEKSREKLSKLEAGIESAKAEVARAERFHTFTKSNPDLPADESAPGTA